MISCGYEHSMALTECGHAFSWGDNNNGQLGLNNMENTNKPSIVLLSNEIPIKKISCSYCHSLLLSSDGDIYLFGWIGFELKHITPKKLIDTNKFIDIASHYSHMISIRFSVNGIYYVWGQIGKI